MSCSWIGMVTSSRAGRALTVPRKLSASSSSQAGTPRPLAVSRHILISSLSRLPGDSEITAPTLTRAAGTSTRFLVFQAQRDLSQARNNELRAILDYNQSVVDFETVQEVPIGGGGGVTATTVSTLTQGPVQ